VTKKRRCRGDGWNKGSGKLVRKKCGKKKTRIFEAQRSATPIVLFNDRPKHTFGARGGARGGLGGGDSGKLTLK